MTKLLPSASKTEKEGKQKFMMSQSMIQLIKSRVWNKLTKIDENEFQLHLNNFCSNWSYSIGVIDCVYGQFKYDTFNEPNFPLLTKAIKAIK